MLPPVAVVLVIALALPGPFAAGGQGQASSELPVSLARIKRALREAPPARTLDQLKLAYYVSVTAEGPRINVFKDVDWKHGLVPGSIPSHEELFQQVTPQEFRPAVADLTAVAAWLGSKVFRRATSK